MEEHLLLVTYDIADPKRWRAIYRYMRGYGEWLQLSVFQCRLSRRRQVELIAGINDLIDSHEDHVLIVDVGVADTVDPKITSLGKAFSVVTREAIVV